MAKKAQSKTKADETKAKDEATQQDPNAEDTAQTSSPEETAQAPSDPEGSGTDTGSTTTAPRPSAGSDEPIAADEMDAGETGTTAQGADVTVEGDPVQEASARPLRTAPFTQSLEAQNPRTRQQDQLARISERRRNRPAEATEGEDAS